MTGPVRALLRTVDWPGCHSETRKAASSSRFESFFFLFMPDFPRKFSSSNVERGSAFEEPLILLHHSLN